MMNNDSNGESKIERLKRQLYSRRSPDVSDAVRQGISLEGSSPEVSSWQSPETGKFDDLAAKMAHKVSKHHSLAKKLFSFSLALFGVAVLVAGFVFFGGVNRISSKNVDINIIGPVSVGGGQEFSFEVEVLNNNNVDLEGVKMTLEYPNGARRAPNLSEDLKDESVSLGTIKNGSSASEQVRIVLFGEKEEEKEFRVTIDYSVKNSNAKFFKEKIYKIAISSSPILVTSTYPKEVNSNQDIVFSVELVANSTDAPKNFLLNINYPFGFNFKTATPAPTFGNNTWQLSGLKQGSKQTVVLRGTVTGQDNEERVFKINAGTPSEDDARIIGVSLVNLDESILVKRPFIGLDTRIGGASGDFILKDNGNITASVNVKNNTQGKIFNVITTAAFSGAGFSEELVRVNGAGFFRSIDKTIFWDERSIPKFSALSPGEVENLSFDFSPVPYERFPVGSKPEIYIKVKSAGDRILESGETERVETVEDRIVKIATGLSVSQKILRNGNNISNFGPLPPRVNQKTSYTVVWSLKNTFNIASNINVTAVLPPYMEWAANVNPKTENMIYNPDTHQVSWNVGSLLPGVGFTSPPRETAFQVVFTPSSSQVGTEPEIVGTVNVSGIDKVTSVNVGSASTAVTTHFTDSSFKSGDERVVQ